MKIVLTVCKHSTNFNYFEATHMMIDSM